MAEERGGGRDDFVPCLKGKEAFGWMLCVGSEKVAKHMLRTQLVLVRSMCLVGRLLFVSELAFEVFCGLFVLFFAAVSVRCGFPVRSCRLCVGEEVTME